MSERLKADIGRIRQSAATVERIRHALDSSGKLVDGYDHAVGQRALAHALHDFANNWKLHREKICRDLETFSLWAHKAADEYERADRKLAQALTNPGGEA